MGKRELSIDEREQRLIAAERAIGRLRELQIEDLAVLDTAQVATGDGSRALSEWTAGRLDMGPDTAKTLVRTMRRLQDRPDLQECLREGEVSFDRVEALSPIPEDVGIMEWAGVSTIRREASRRVRVTAETGVPIGEGPVSGDAALLGRVVVAALGWSRRPIRCDRRQGPVRGSGRSLGPSRR
jgi:hypothetical protein